MAQVATTSSLIEALRSSELRHCWNDDGRLVFGDFPTISAVFDFGDEKLISVAEKVKEETAATEKKFIDLLPDCKRKTEIMDLEFPDRIIRVGSNTQLLVEGLNVLEDLVPGTHEKMAQDPKLKKQSKRPVARSHAELYDGKKDAKYSEKLQSGFFVATNNKSDEAVGFLKGAAETAGFEWRKDIQLIPK